MALLKLLCPLDLSTASRGALRYALVIARHVGASLEVVTVQDPLVVEAAELTKGSSWLARQVERDFERAFDEAGAETTPRVEVSFSVAAGKPASEILRRASETGADLIVMSSRGNSDARKLFFGATAERVLRETTVPVLITPSHEPGPPDVDHLRRKLGHVLAPVDVTQAFDFQLDAARALAAWADGTVLLLHVIEPLWFPTAARPELPSSDAERRYRVERLLSDAARPFAGDGRIEPLTAFGDPAEEIAKIADGRDVGLIVVGLHGVPRNGSRMGSVTYRVLCLARTLVLALPPAWKLRTGA